MQDFMYQSPGLIDPNIVVIGIDEKSMEELGLFQRWSRQIMADAINILNSSPDYKPAVIAIDILYIGASGDDEADANLARAAQDGGNVVTVSHAVFDDSRNGMSVNKVMQSYEIPFLELALHATYGLSNGTIDDDHLIRRANLRAAYNEETVYSFPYMIYKAYGGEDLDDYLHDNYDVYITYSGVPGDYSVGVSFSDIFSDDFDPELFADCIVLIGPTASGLGDSYQTPIASEQMPGVEIHANVVQMLLEGNLKTYAPFEINLIILIVSMLLAIVPSKLDIRILLGIIIVFCASYLFVVRFVYDKGYILTIIYPLFSVTILFVYQLIYGYVLEAFEKQRLKSTFKKYVDPELVDKLVDSGEADSEEVGKKKNIAVMFVDVRNFTPMTERLRDRPELMVNILNEYLELTSRSVFDNGGSVDKFIGDATMALFNGFFSLDDYEFKAVKAAWDIVQGADNLNASIREKYGVNVGFGIGVNCGEAIVGNIGPSFRKDYTAIGDTVNTAARLESNAKPSQVLISKDLYDIVKGRVEAVSVGELPLKGKSIKIEVYSVTDVIIV